MELHQMDIKTTFLNGNLEKKIYMNQSEGFSIQGKESLRVCIDKVLEIYGMKTYRPSVAPVIKGDKFSLSQCLQNDLEREPIKDIPYSLAVGGLMYVMTCTRPAISYAVAMLGRYVSNPGMNLWVAAKKVMRYLQGTKDYMLTYRATDQLEVISQSNSDFASCLDSRKSTSGYVFLLAGGIISWKSKKQTCVSTSTMEAEFVA
ncbi:secreted RxLR effector protein 161-like [Telopea speciosissima]|uniref:secreted RxLR effector protein 161-like n=1 Tax=Telopea speciosissima TaxID=54955 RepID=UPI001CC606D7|nr:secreted RxLR effector protein 161-like [Telopea speciosissima]